jgi:hypothetical protein
VLKAYAVGFFSAVLAVAVVAGIWLALQPEDEAGLRWGGTVYTSKQEFDGYLRSKGLSYRVWLARNPGAAPWEPAPVPASSAAGTPAAGSSEWWARNQPLAIGFVLVAGWALLLVLLSRRRTDSQRLRELAGKLSHPRPSPRRPSPRRLRELAGKVSRPRPSPRRPSPLRLRELMGERNIGAGDIAFGVLAVMAVAVFGMFVVVLVSA